MKNLLLIVMFAAAPAAAQEFAAEMPAMANILAKTQALKAAAASEKTINTEVWTARAAKAPAAAPALAPLTYDPREIRFEALETPDKAIGIYHKELRLATLHIGGMMIGKHVVFRLIGYLESSRQRAIASGCKVSIDDAAISLYNETGFLNRKALSEPERFGAIIQVTDVAAAPSR